MKHTTESWVLRAVFLLILLAFAVFPRLRWNSNDADPIVVNARPLKPEANAPAAPKPAATNPAPARATKVTSNISVLLRRSWHPDVAEVEFARFAEWANRYLRAAPQDRAGLEAEGLRLAGERRAALRNLIQSNPGRALELAVPAGVRRALPASVVALLEERVSGRGSLDVLAALAEPGKEAEVKSTFRTATVEGREYEAFVYGRRLGEPTRRDLALNGLAVDGLLAVNENPLRLLDPEEIAGLPQSKSEPLCAVSGKPSASGESPTVADLGGQPTFLCSLAHAEKLNEDLIKAEVAANGEEGGGGEVQGSARTEGIKRLLLIRVDFVDLAGAPFPDATGVSLISGLNTFYMESSYGRSGFQASGAGSDVTPTLRMPQMASYYGQNNYYTQLRTDARNAAAAAGYVLNNYDYDCICFGAVPGWGWAGLGYVGAAGVWLRSYFTPGVAGHELGHNYGLNHANYWDTSGQSIIGSGNSVEYGDIYDTMGSANAGANHFNARYKSYLNWLTAGETLNVTGSGTYRVYAHDDTSAAAGVRGLKIVRDSYTNYWIEFRQKFTGNRWLMSGAGIRWAGNGNERSQLLDTTPGSPDGKNDAALVLGRTFSDTAAGIHITTLRKNGTTPESLDMAINLGTFPGNSPPSISISASTTSASLGGLITFTAAATDANGDPLAYYWDFGDATFGTNGPAAGKSWSNSGEYVVRCVASDMKGGEASDSVIVTVGSPFSYRISGRVTANALPVEGVRVWVSSTRMTYTDSDGTYTLTGLPVGSYMVAATLDGYNFSAAGFANPVAVGPNASGIDFSSGTGGSGSVALTSPANNANYTAPATVAFAASATPSSGATVTRVEFFEGNNKLGEDTTSPYNFTWNNAAAGSYSLRARSTDSGGIVVTSTPVAMTISPAAPAITANPQNQTVAAGGTATFTVTASGAAPLTYQWRCNGTNVAGGVSATLQLLNLQMQQAGGYSVVVTNSAGAATSAVATLTVTCSYVLSASSGSFTASGGGGSVNVTSQGGCAWTVGNVPAWIAITSGNGGSGSGTVNYTVAANGTSGIRSSTLLIAGRSYVVTQAAPDLVRPNVAFTSPAANSSFTNSIVTVTGTADDNMALARVEYRVGSASFALASGTTVWNTAVTLSAGTNIVSVRSVDVAGNISLTNTRSIFCSIPGTITVVVHGNGKVSGATNGQKFQIGRSYKIEAAPNPGCVFSNWTGDVTSDMPELSFFMQSNIVVAANFVTNPFVHVKGVFNGLFYESNAVQLGQSGAFTFKLSERGRYTASLRLGTRRSSATGQLRPDGTATNTIPRKGTNALVVTWNVALDGSDVITGQVGDGVWTADLIGDRATFNRATNPAPQAGRYTFVLLGSPGAGFAPEGDSYGTGSADSNGVVRLKAYLADKSALASRVPLSKAGVLPVYAALYRGRGALLGWATFEGRAGTDVDGVMSWIKPALPESAFYPAGFNSQAALLGSRYVPPPSAADPFLSFTDAVVCLTGGNLAQAFTNDVAFAANGQVTNASPSALSMRFIRSSGLFRGRFTPAGQPQSCSFNGVVVQKADFASGYFLGTNQSGRVTLEAAP